MHPESVKRELPHAPIKDKPYVKSLYDHRCAHSDLSRCKIDRSQTIVRTRLKNRRNKLTP
jgi:hypothetical protein